MGINMLREARPLLGALTVASLCALGSAAQAAVITFDDLVSGAASYAYDGDGDGVADAVFSTNDPDGFNTVGPGANMSYINEPGIEGTTTLAADLRVDFNRGAVGSLGFGFAMNADVGGPPASVTFSIYSAIDALLATGTFDADFTEASGPGTTSSFPEGLVSLGFSGEAAYAVFDFDGTVANRYIIDNFTGTFGSTERVPEPGTLALAALALAGLGLGRRRR